MSAVTVGRIVPVSCGQGVIRASVGLVRRTAAPTPLQRGGQRMGSFVTVRSRAVAG